MAASKVSFKLLVDKNGKKVLFVEAGKDFIDFLFNIMSMPVGTVTRLLTKNSMVGSLGNLYDSIETLSETYLQTNQTRVSLLRPKAPPSALNLPALLPKECNNNNNTSAPVYAKRLYQCQNAFSNDTGPPVYYQMVGQTNTSNKCRSNVSDDCQARCPNCNMLMSTELTYINPPPKQPVKPITHGFVKEVVTYMAMDDLAVSPMSTIYSITLLNKFGIKGIDTLEERVVDLGMDEVVKLYAVLFHTTNLKFMFTSKILLLGWMSKLLLLCMGSYLISSPVLLVGFVFLPGYFVVLQLAIDLSCFVGEAGVSVNLSIQ